MTTLTRRPAPPLAEVLGWLDEMTGVGTPGPDPASHIRIEDFVDDDAYVLRAEMPGVDPDRDVHIDVADGILTITGERHDQHHGRHRHEFHYGSFSRSVRLPPNAEPADATAAYRDGMLELRVPLTSTSVDAKRIPVRRTGE